MHCPNKKHGKYTLTQPYEHLKQEQEIPKAQDTGSAAPTCIEEAPYARNTEESWAS